MNAARIKTSLAYRMGRLRTTWQAHSYRSFSQSGEDMIVRFALQQMGIAKPTYLDIGAYHPTRFSNTAYFYSVGGRGINVEPNPVLFRAFLKQRPADVNLNVGVGRSSGETNFYVMAPDTLSTFDRETAEALSQLPGHRLQSVMRVKVLALPDLIGQYCGDRTPDFLTLDAEGLDIDILQSVDFSRWSPAVICCETLTYTSDNASAKNQTLVAHLESSGYMLLADTFINSIFVQKTRWRRDE
jgi:FkbM family methyltransferase